MQFLSNPKQIIFGILVVAWFWGCAKLMAIHRAENPEEETYEEDARGGPAAAVAMLVGATVLFMLWVFWVNK